MIRRYDIIGRARDNLSKLPRLVIRYFTLEPTCHIGAYCACVPGKTEHLFNESVPWNIFHVKQLMCKPPVQYLLSVSWLHWLVPTLTSWGRLSGGWGAGPDPNHNNNHNHHTTGGDVEADWGWGAGLLLDLIPTTASEPRCSRGWARRLPGCRLRSLPRMGPGPDPGTTATHCCTIKLVECGCRSRYLYLLLLQCWHILTLDGRPKNKGLRAYFEKFEVF